jgi:predicted transcriptional regulator
MATVTIRMPDDKLARLRQLAQRRKISLNKLMEELATVALTEFDAATRFRASAARGPVAEGLRLLDKLDAAVEASGAEGGQEEPGQLHAFATRTSGGWFRPQPPHHR